MSRKFVCLRCGHACWPRVSDPKQCPECKSKIWRTPKTTKPEEINKVLIYGDEHPHYSYHYHILTDPSFSQDQTLDLLMKMLKTELDAKTFDSIRQEWRSENYRLTHDKVLKRRVDDPNYFERILHFSDPEHLHIFFYTDEGRDLFIQVVKQCFPNAVFEIKEMDEAELEENREHWRIYTKAHGGLL